MNRYIQQLIQDLAEVEASPTEQINFEDMSYQEFEETILEFENGNKRPAKEILNVSYEELPPVERLNKAQIQKLLIAIFNALEAKGTNVHVPGSGAPVEIVYSEIRRMFKDGFYAMPGWNIDFCSGNCEDCSFMQYCDTYNKHKEECGLK